MTDAEVITRPNGKVYRPRNPGLRAHAWEGEDDGGVIVFGTLDSDRARPFAAEMCNHWYGMPIAVDARPGWYRDGFRYGERTWIRDEERGAPGVMFKAEDAPLPEVQRPRVVINGNACCGGNGAEASCEACRRD